VAYTKMWVRIKVCNRCQVWNHCNPIDGRVPMSFKTLSTFAKSTFDALGSWMVIGNDR
jgi:hypothetical protein